MKHLPRLGLLLATPLLLGMEQAEQTHSNADAKLLMGKWIVRSVEQDGKPTAAQIGREAGDIIEIKKDDGGLMLT